MGSRNYKRFLELLKEWPVDSSRKGRDLGELLHKRVGQAFRDPATLDSKVGIKKLA